MTKETIVHKMINILDELSDVNDIDVTDANFRKYYEEAAHQLDINDDEDDDGELDIYRVTYDLGERYIDLRRQLKNILLDEEYDLNDRMDFYRKYLINKEEDF